MHIDAHISVIIPALNEERSIGLVLRDIPDYVDEIVVVDNGSTDSTADEARKAGATVLFQEERGYGAACLKGIEYLTEREPKPDAVVFLDADYSDHPEQMDRVVGPVISGEADLVIGSRSTGQREKGSMTIPQVFGNWLATTLLYWFYRQRFTDLGPFRAVSWNALASMGMMDRNYGWTVEMQLRAAKIKLRCFEVPVDYRRRVGQSKVSGTVKGTIMAGYKILWTIFRYL